MNKSTFGKTLDNLLDGVEITLLCKYQYNITFNRYGKRLGRCISADFL